MGQCYKVLLCALIAMFTWFGMDAQTISQSNHLSSTVDFIENKGQWHTEVRFMTQLRSGVMFITDNGFVYNFTSRGDSLHTHDIPEQIQGHAYRINFVNARESTQYIAGEKRNFYHNYLQGKDTSKWAGHVGVYGSVIRPDLYPGIDLKIYGNDSQSLKYDFIVGPEVDVSVIMLEFTDVEPELDKEGNLRIRTSVNEIIEKAPYAYQEINGQIVPVECRYKLSGSRLSFDFPNDYDKAYPLVIDPEVVFSTYTAWDGTHWSGGVTTYDKEGNMYISALMNSRRAGWPVNWGAYQVYSPDKHLIPVIAKFKSDGSDLIYATYFLDTFGIASTLRVNDNNELIVAGFTFDSNLPVTDNAFQATLNGLSDLYVLRFSADGSNVLACTYIGGTDYEAVTIFNPPYSLIGENAPNQVDIVLDAEKNVWVTSTTQSIDFPTTTHAFQAAHAGGSEDVVLFKLSPDFSELMYSSYFGGVGMDAGVAIEYNNQNNTIGLVGYTGSSNFPVTSGAYKATFSGGGTDGYALLIDGSTCQLEASTYLGTGGSDYAFRPAFDCHDNFYVAGKSNGNYPVTNTVAQGLVPDGLIFLDKLSPNLSASLASTRTGGNVFSYLLPSAMNVDVCGNVILTVSALTPLLNMPLTPDAFETDVCKFYIAAFEPDFAGLKFGSYFGLTLQPPSTGNAHVHHSISRIDKWGMLYQSLCVGEGNFPTTSGAYKQTKVHQGMDPVNFKININANEPVLAVSSTVVSGGGVNDSSAHCVRGCKSAYIHYAGISTDSAFILRLEIGGNAINGEDYAFIPDSLVIASGQPVGTVEVKPLVSPLATPPDTRFVTIGVKPPCGYCEVLFRDTVWIYDSLYVDLPIGDTSCTSDTIAITAKIGPGLGFAWSPANSIPDAGGLTIRPAPDTTTTFRITVYQPGAPPTCPARTLSYTAYVEPYPEILTNEIYGCYGDSIDVLFNTNPDGLAYTYTWLPPDYLRNDFDRLNRFWAPPGSYKKYVTATTPGAECKSTDSLLIVMLPPFEFDWVSPMDTTITYGDSIQLTSQGAALSWLWTPGRYLNSPILRDPWCRPWEPMTYRLIGYDEFGCTDTVDVRIGVNYQPGEWLPNAFSPNGDGVNDVFRIENVRYEKLLEFRIFNRYGQVMFETQNPTDGWDGRFNHRPADLGTYFYSIKLIRPNGEIEQFKGDFLLLR